MYFTTKRKATHEILIFTLISDRRIKTVRENLNVKNLLKDYHRKSKSQRKRRSVEPEKRPDSRIDYLPIN